MDELAASFVSMRSTLTELQGERIQATERVLASSAALKAAAEGVSDAQVELNEAEERRKDAELDIVLTLRAMPGAGSGLSSEEDKHSRGGRIVTVPTPGNACVIDKCPVGLPLSASCKIRCAGRGVGCMHDLFVVRSRCRRRSSGRGGSNVRLWMG